MRGNVRQKTNIVVSVIDFSKFIAEQEKTYAEEYDLPEAKISIGKIGFIKIGKDKYMLDDEGIISRDPISKTNTWEAYMHVNLGNKVRLELIEIKPEDTLDVKEQVNLADFIRVFGSRLECNYNGVIEHIEGMKAKSKKVAVGA